VQIVAHHLRLQRKTKNFLLKKAILNQEDALLAEQQEKLTHQEAADVAAAVLAADAVALEVMTNLNIE
jgi:hypothetical protein